jgi:UrcA family protein
MLKTSLIAASLAGLALCTQPAAARPASATPASAELMVQQRSVRYADLDLTTAQGQARLDSRLRHAAAAVCEVNSGPHPLTEVMAARRCYREALQSAQRTVASLGTVKVAAR